MQMVPGKFAMCPHCGNTSADYNNCDSCKKMIPDDPKYYYPGGNRSQKSDGTSNANQSAKTSQHTTQLILAHSGTALNKKLFYGDKIQTQMLVYGSQNIRGPLRKVNATTRNIRLISKGRGRAKKPPAEPEMVTISSSEDEGEGTANVGEQVDGDTATVPKVGESPSNSRSNSPNVATSTCNLPGISVKLLTRKQKMEDEVILIYIYTCN